MMSTRLSQWYTPIRKKTLNTLDILSSFHLIGIILLLGVSIVFHLNPENILGFKALHYYLFIYFGIDVTLRFLTKKTWRQFMLTHAFDLALIAPLYAWLHHGALPFLIQELILLGILIGRFRHLPMLMRQMKLKPAQLFLFGFLFLMLSGALLLSLPIALKGQEIPFIDAIFMAFSAVCVTGLSVVDVSSTFTFFGQCVILGLIQVGGLGVMTFSVLLAMIFRRKLSQIDSQEFQDSYQTYSIKETFSAIGFIFRVTFIIEFLGAICLLIGFYEPGTQWQTQLFNAIFHSISAFCNAGFSLFSDSFVGYATNPTIIFSLSGLIILGGIGFPTLYNLAKIARKKQHVTLKLQTKMVLWITLILLGLGTLLIFVVEYNQALIQYSLSDKLLISFFQSVSARTAGFNSIELSNFSMATIMMIMILMVIGASPGSTGGGIKTSTFGLILVSFYNTIRFNMKVELAGRAVNNRSILKAFSVLLLALTCISFVFYGLLLTENAPFLSIFFETVSAFGTVGFSLGLTSELSSIGKCLLMILMFIGRIGPLSLAFALSIKRSPAKYQYPEEPFVIA